MQHLQQLRWLVNRFRVMPSAEIPHRIREQVRHLTDRHALWSVPAPPACPETMPKIDLCKLKLSVDEQGLLRDDMLGLLDGSFQRMGVSWHSRRAWGLDPVSAHQWPMNGTALSVVDGNAEIRLGWELLRLQHLQVLAFAADALDSNAAREAVIGDLNDLADHDRFGHGLMYTSGIECGLRITSLLLIGAWVPLPKSIWTVLHHHAQWLQRYPSLYSSANNHRIAELMGLYLLGLCAPQMDVGGLDALEAELFSVARGQFHPDGVGTEQSLAYQAFCTEMIALCRIVGGRSGREVSALDEVLHRSADFLGNMTDENGHHPQFGDADDSVVICPQLSWGSYINSISGMVAGVLEQPLLAATGWRSDVRSRLLGLPAIANDIPKASRCFSAGGYTVLRRARCLVAFDHGPLGFWSTGGHGHADALSVWMHAGGQPMWVESGTHAYRDSLPWRTWNRGTAAHSTLRINGQDQSVQTGPFNWGQRAEAQLRSVDLDAGWVEASHNGYEAAFGLIHVRRVSLGGQHISIVDRLEGTGAHDVVVSIHLAVGLTAAVTASGVVSVCQGDMAIAMMHCETLTPTLMVGDGQPGPGMVSSGYRTSHRATCVQWKGHLEAPCKWELSWKWSSARFLEDM